jgi:hypothetical protein
VLISYQVREEPLPGPGDPHVQLSFAHPGGHPMAPPEVQAAIDTLTFAPWDGQAPRAI